MQGTQQTPWYGLKEITAAKLLELAMEGVRNHAQLVGAEAVVSHVGFRSRSHEEWQQVEALFLPLGTRHVTHARGRQIPFIKLAQPLTFNGHTLHYVEFPEPKTPPVEEPSLIVVFRNPVAEATSQTLDQWVVRQNPKGAEDFIAEEQAGV